MNNAIKYSLWGITGVAGVVVAAVGYIAATFDPNDYKQPLVDLVQQQYQRSLTLEGDIQLKLFPSIGASLGKVSLSEAGSEQPFAAVNQLDVSLEFMPLLSQRVVVDRVTVDGLQATLIKHADGSTNIDDLLAKADADADADAEPAESDASAVAFDFDISAISLSNAALRYQDKASGADYQLNQLQLQTGRITPGMPVDLSLSSQLKGNQPELALETELTGQIGFDLAQQDYQLLGLTLTVNGQLQDIKQLQLKLQGDISASLPRSQVDVNQLILDISGQQAANHFTASLALPTLQMTEQHFVAKDMDIAAQLDAEGNKLSANIQLPELQGNPEALTTDSLRLQAKLVQPQQTINAKLNSPLRINIPAQQLKLEQLVLALTASGDQLPGKQVSSELKGSLAVDGIKQQLQTQLAGGLLQSQLKAEVAVNNFEKPAIKFNIELDKLNVDQYLPESSTQQTAQADPPEQAIDLSALRELNLDGRLKIGALQAANIKADNLQLVVKANAGKLNINPLSADLYQGTMSGRVMVDARDTPAITLNQQFKGISVAPLTQDAAGFDNLEGRGNIAVNLKLHGHSVSAMKQALQGDVALNLSDGAIKGINVAKTIREAKALFGKGAQTVAADDAQKTDFSELKATFSIRDGVAHNNDLSLKSPLLRMGGEGDIDIAQGRINYLARATLANTLKGQGGSDEVSGLTIPLRAQGPFDDLKYTLDFEDMFKQAAKAKLDAKKAELKAKAEESITDKTEALKEKVQDKLQDVFKGLF